MGKKIPKFSKLALSALLAVFALTFLFSSGSGGFLKSSMAEAAGPAIGLTIDNPGIRTAAEVQNRQSERLMGIPGVVGHGIGILSDGEPVITIFVERAGIPGIPAALEGVPTEVEVTGMFVAYADPTARFPRPVPIGVSTGHPDITAGTIGCRVTDGTNVYALSNNHVYANQNDANIGDSALQPGPYDGGQDPEDAIGTLYDYEPIDFSGGNNIMDAAIAFSSIYELDTSTPSDDGYGMPKSSIFGDSNADGFIDKKDSLLNLLVQKYGRTTGLTDGQVAEINVTVDVCYQTAGPFRCKKLARFVDQIGITPGDFSAGGDSGSLIVTDDGNNYPVGLLFAGSSTRTLANRIDLVLERFNVTVDDSATTPSDNNPPSADFTFTTADLAADFTDQSTDSDGSVIAWDWDFGDGNTSTAQNPSHTYAAGGTYTVILTVTDDDGAIGTTSQEVIVSEPSAGVNVDSIIPNSMQAGTTMAVTISGSGFAAGADATFENGSGPNPTASNVVVSSDATTITADVTAKSGGPPRNRLWDVRVTNPDGSSDVLVDGFTVTP